MMLSRWIAILFFVALALSVAQPQMGVVSGGVIGVKGAPFSADIVQEGDRVLDGKRVHYEIHGKICRDSEGRTRSEMQRISPPYEGLVEITIVNLVRGEFIQIDPQTKKAFLNHVQQPAQAESEPGATGNGGQGAVVPGFRREALGSRTIEGFQAEGTKIVVEQPAPHVNAKLTSESETWYSAQLKTVVLMRSGKSSVWRLTNIRQGDPDPLLFQIPPDYKVEVVEPR